MKTHFIEVKYEKKVEIPKDVLDRLPKEIMLFLTAQLMDQKEDVIKQLQKAGKKVCLTKPRHTIHEGQILGCSTEKQEGDFDAFFYIGDGMFHPQALIIKNDKPVHVWDAINEKYKLLTKKDAEMTRNRINAAKTAFLMAKNIGVLVTTKPGQNKLVHFMNIRDNYADKRFYYLVNNNIEFGRLEDFPFIDCFVNTVCERIATDDYDKFNRPVLNFEDLP